MEPGDEHVIERYPHLDRMPFATEKQENAAAERIVLNDFDLGAAAGVAVIDNDFFHPLLELFR